MCAEATVLPQHSRRRKLQQRLLGSNGWVLITVGTISMTAASLGHVTSGGPFGFLHANRVAAVGFIEAYGLAALVGLGLRLAATADHLRRWHILAALIHTGLFTVNLTFWDLYAHLGLVPAGWIATASHAVLALLESTAAIRANDHAPSR
jgi:phosphoglycerol transferase MdoB-like AlkP superfamily enzyme